MRPRCLDGRGVRRLRHAPTNADLSARGARRARHAVAPQLLRVLRPFGDGVGRGSKTGGTRESAGGGRRPRRPPVAYAAHALVVTVEVSSVTAPPGRRGGKRAVESSRARPLAQG